MSVEWIARTPPKRQVEGSNPSEPVNDRVHLFIDRTPKVLAEQTTTQTRYWKRHSQERNGIKNLISTYNRSTECLLSAHARGTDEV